MGCDCMCPWRWGTFVGYFVVACVRGEGGTLWAVVTCARDTTTQLVHHMGVVSYPLSCRVPDSRFLSSCVYFQRRQRTLAASRRRRVVTSTLSAQARARTPWRRRRWRAVHTQ